MNKNFTKQKKGDKQLRMGLGAENTQNNAKISM